MGRAGTGRPSRISVVVSTYRRPRDLERVLEGYAGQTDPDFEVVVADDGSGAETEAVVAERARRGGPRLVHVWHEDRGFRKTEILDRAVLAAEGDYLVFTDGDCVPRRDFVGTHRRLAAPGRFLSGGYVRLPPGLSETLTVDEVADGRAFDPAWLRGRGVDLGRHVLRLRAPGPLPALLDRVTPTKASWNGMNASTWREAILAANGFDLELGYGGEDRELGQRLENAGLRGLQVRHRAVLLHLHHERPYRDPEVQDRQRRLLGEVRRDGRLRAGRGIDELPHGVGARVTRPGGATGAPAGPVGGEA